MIVQSILLGVITVFSVVYAAPAEKRQNPPYSFFVVQCPSENISPQAANECVPLAGTYLYDLAYDKEPFGTIYVNKWVGAVEGSPQWDPILFSFDPVHTSFNYSDEIERDNLIVVQSSQGKTISYPFQPPNNEYWVVNGFSVTSAGEVELYGFDFPAWSACLITDPNTQKTTYQLFYQNFGTGCTAIQLFLTSTPPP